MKSAPPLSVTDDFETIEQDNRVRDCDSLDHANPGFVNQSRCLQCLARQLVRHLARGQPSQFLVNQGQQSIRGGGIALLSSIPECE